MQLPPLAIRRIAGTTTYIRDVTFRSYAVAIYECPSHSTIGKLLAKLSNAGVTDVELPVPPASTGMDLRADFSMVNIALAVSDAASASRAVQCRPTKLLLTMSASEAGNHALAGCSRTDSLSRLETAMQIAGEAGIAVCASIRAAFGCPIDGDSASDDALNLADFFAANGAQEIVMCDDNGLGNPLSVERLCDGLRERWQALDVTVELSDRRGLALANALAALGTGITRFHASLVPTKDQLSTLALSRMLGGMECATGIDPSVLERYPLNRISALLG